MLPSGVPLQTLGFEKYRRAINRSPQSMQESDFASECSNSTDRPFQRRYNVSSQGPGGCIVGKYNVTKKRLSTERGFSAIVWKAADNCDVTMVATLRLRDMTIQHVGHQGARLAASRGVYFRSPGKLFRRAMARESDRAPQNRRSALV